MADDWKPRYLPSDGVIYFAKCQEYVKIGFTRLDPEVRVKAFETGNPFEVILITTMEGTLETEQQLHERFAEHHFRGEWFVYAKPIQDFVNEIRNAEARAAIAAERLEQKRDREARKMALKNAMRRKTSSGSPRTRTGTAAL